MTTVKVFSRLRRVGEVTYDLTVVWQHAQDLHKLKPETVEVGTMS